MWAANPHMSRLPRPINTLSAVIIAHTPSATACAVSPTQAPLVRVPVAELSPTHFREQSTINLFDIPTPITDHIPSLPDDQCPRLTVSERLGRLTAVEPYTVHTVYGSSATPPAGS